MQTRDDIITEIVRNILITRAYNDGLTRTRCSLKKALWFSACYGDIYNRAALLRRNYANGDGQVTRVIIRYAMHVIAA